MAADERDRRKSASNGVCAVSGDRRKRVPANKQETDDSFDPNKTISKWKTNGATS